jgi:FKBP-type peptidyl-prolyl cis-trans isomerase SlyD
MISLRVGLLGAAAFSAPVIFLATTGNGSTERPLPVADDMKVTLEYTLMLSDNQVVDSTAGQEPITYVHGQREIVPGLEKALTGMKPGETKHIAVPALEAYGPYDPKKRITVPKDKVPAGAKAGTRLRSKEGQEATVIEVKGDSVVVDTNHPLAGKNLVFDVKILKVESVPKPTK